MKRIIAIEGDNDDFVNMVADALEQRLNDMQDEYKEEVLHVDYYVKEE